MLWWAFIVGESTQSASGNYEIKAYVIGDYFDKYVSIERGAFNFQDEDGTALYPISKKNIERSVTKLAASHFEQKLEPLKDKNIERIKAVVDENMPWNKRLLRGLDFAS